MLKAADIMTRDVATIGSSATVAEAVLLMKERGWRSLIVERQHDQDAYGIISETDIVYKVAALGKDPRKMRVYEIMTKPCIVVNPELGVEYVARLFANHRLRIAPVIQGTLLGVISVSDILTKSNFIEEPREVSLGQKVDEAIALARRLCDEQGPTSEACLNAWATVDELQAEAAFQQGIVLEKTAFEAFCEEFPEAMEARLYRNWCSG
ncbi:MAG TPA: CBS domain-containing protein [Synechococcales cyanobacterium M55_K2018_004]|nr:CBS domain-containing protein [Synechococcales cyanobacterium M55_K2018_004]